MSSSSTHSPGTILESSDGSLIGMIVHAIVCLSCVCLFHSLVASIAGENARNQAAALAASLSKNNTQLELEEETEEETTTNGDYVQAGGSNLDDSLEHESTAKQDSVYTNKLRIGKLSKEDMVALTVKLWILMLLNYLLLVYLPGSVALSFLAVFAIWGLTLHEYLMEELVRRKRIDRIVLLFALFFSIAMSLTAFTYHRITFQQGDVYQGAARIVGYDTSVYQNSDGESLRTNLEVNWGGQWACPRSGTQCQAVVEGALCQTKYDPSEYDEQRRALTKKKNQTATITYATDDKVKAEEEEFVDEVVDEANEEVQEYEEEVIEEADAEVTVYEEEVDEEATEIVEEVEGEAEEVEEEKEELEKENEQLKEKVEEEEEEVEEEEEEVEEEAEEVEELEDELNYEYEDDYYESDYWDTDWDSVWGEYACEDLFDQDVNSLSPFDPATPPGSDDWPTVQVYGSCRSCDAFLMDYYTTEHFLAIQEFQAQYFIYAFLAIFLYVLAGLLGIREHLRPSQEKQIVLLNNEGGVVA